jgi:glucose/arabinose dehydrogenase
MNDVWYSSCVIAIATLGLFCIGASSALAQSPASEARSAAVACPTDDTALRLPAGFCASIFADGIGHARHLVVAPNGVVYVNTWSGRYYGNDTPHAGGVLVALQDTTDSGKADVNERFGETVQSGGAGGTGIGLYHGALYAALIEMARAEILSKYPPSTLPHHQQRRPGQCILH